MVNRSGSRTYDPALQRHHLLPSQLLSLPCFSPMMVRLGEERIGFHDFRRNGMLLPAREDAVRRLALPLHRGPHREYNAMVIDRVGQIEQRWSHERAGYGLSADRNAVLALARLQQGLRRELLDQRRPLRLNSKDPLNAGFDFSSLDTLAEMLWQQA